jgi:cytochrome P450
MAPIFGVVILSVVFLFAAIFIGLYIYFTRNFKFWQKLGVPYVKPTPFVGNLKECVFLKTTMGQQLQRLYVENSDKPYVGIFSFDKPSLLICDLELVKKILVKDWQNFMDHILTVNTKLDPVFGRNLFVLKGKRWQQFRANLSPVFTPGKMKVMFPLVDICGKELADYVDKITAEGK